LRFPAGGLFSPSLDGGLPLFVLSKPRRRSSSAIRASWASSKSISSSFDKRARASRFIEILESLLTALVNQNLCHQRRKPTKSALLNTFPNLATIGQPGQLRFFFFAVF